MWEYFSSETQESTESTSENIEQRKNSFASYLKSEGINAKDFPRDSWKWKFLRTFRYYPEIVKSTKENNIPLEYFFSLKMIEWEWDPTNINTLDGWAGISQIQPDTFKWFAKQHLNKDWKVFSDNKNYKGYDYATLMKQHKKREVVNSIIAKKLLQIKKEKKSSFGELSKLDDRFNPAIALEFSGKYLLYCKKNVDISTLKDASWNAYKQDPKYNFEWLLALNGYNKWPGNYGKNFEGSHITNIKKRVDQYREYSKQLDAYVKQWLNNNQIIEKFSSLEKKGTAQKAPGEIKNLKYLNISKDKQWNIYRFTVPTTSTFTNITDFLQVTNLYEKFKWKTIILADEHGNPLYSFKKWDTIYIKEKKS